MRILDLPKNQISRLPAEIGMFLSQRLQDPRLASRQLVGRRHWEPLFLLLPQEVAGQGCCACSQSCSPRADGSQCPLWVVMSQSHQQNSAYAGTCQFLRNNKSHEWAVLCLRTISIFLLVLGIQTCTSIFLVNIRYNILEVPLWCSGLRIWYCYSCGSGHNCNAVNVPGPGTSTCGRCSQRKKEKIEYTIPIYQSMCKFSLAYYVIVIKMLLFSIIVLFSCFILSEDHSDHRHCFSLAWVWGAKVWGLQRAPFPQCLPYTSYWVRQDYEALTAFIPRLGCEMTPLDEEQTRLPLAMKAVAYPSLLFFSCDAPHV